MPTPQHIQHVQMLAYQLWEEEGRPEGRDQDHWIEAERRLAQEFRIGGAPEEPAGEKPDVDAGPVDVVPTPRLKATPITAPDAPAPAAAPGRGSTAESGASTRRRKR